MRTFKFLTGSSAALIALTICSAANADHTNPSAGIMQISEQKDIQPDPILLAFNDNMGDLEITMELMDESADSSAAIVNRIKLPANIQKRKKATVQEINREENIGHSEFIFDTSPQIREQTQEQVRENNEMVEVVREQTKEQAQEGRENKEMVEEVREQTKERQSDTISDIQEQAQEVRENKEMIEEVREQAKEQHADTVNEVQEQAQEIRENKEMIEEVRDQAKEQHADTMNEVQEQVQEVRENHEMIEEVREQVKEQHAEDIDEIREQNKKNAEKGK